MTEANKAMSIEDRIEAAEGSSRELDTEIALATGQYVWMGSVVAKVEGNNTHTVPGNGGPLAMVPAYTASIDAAMTLVPEGFNLLLNTSVKMGFTVAQVFDGVCNTYPVKAATPALALCAAALRARTGDTDGG